MTRTEKELSALARLQGFTLVHEPRKPYFLRAWDGTTFGPMTAKVLKVWLSGFSAGAAYHAPDCQCGRVACTHRNLTVGSVS